MLREGNMEPVSREDKEQATPFGPSNHQGSLDIFLCAVTHGGYAFLYVHCLRVSKYISVSKPPIDCDFILIREMAGVIHLVPL